MRGLVCLYKALRAKNNGSLIAGLLFLAAAIAGSYFIILPHFQAAITLTEADLADFSMPPSLQRVIIKGELIGRTNAILDYEYLPFGVLVLDNQLLLVATLTSFPRNETEFIGRLVAHEPEHVEIFESIVAAENLEGSPIPALFILGETPQNTVDSHFAVPQVLLLLGVIAIVRFIMQKRLEALA